MTPASPPVALILQHDSAGSAGVVGERLIQRGFNLVNRDARLPTALPDVRQFEAVVVLGGPANLSQGEAESPWMAQELAQLRTAYSADIPVLGICLGGQLLALAHEGGVRRATRPEIGWTEVHSDDPALVPAGHWFQWHYEGWSTPPLAQEIAHNATSSQAFVFGRSLAVQFHPEITPAILGSKLAAGGRLELEEAALAPEHLINETERRVAQNVVRACQLVDNWLKLI